MESKLTGIVLCGGQSSRMKKDKGLLFNQEGDRWSQIALLKLKQVCNNTAISIRKEQLDPYKKIFPKEVFIVDQEIAAGPMRALLSCYGNLKSDLFVLAVDMIYISPELLKILFQRASNSRKKDIILFKNESKKEVLCGIYRKDMLADLYNRMTHQGLDSFSLQKLGKLYTIETILITSEQKKYFQNMNSPEDLF